MLIRPDEFQRATFAELMEVLGADLDAAVVGPFRTSSRDLIDRGRRALAADDRADLRAAAHSIKGASRTVGLIGMGAIAAQLETGATSESPETLGRWLDELDAAYTRGLTILVATMRGE